MKRPNKLDSTEQVSTWPSKDIRPVTNTSDIVSLKIHPIAEIPLEPASDEIEDVFGANFEERPESAFFKRKKIDLGEIP